MQTWLPPPRALVELFTTQVRYRGPSVAGCHLDTARALQSHFNDGIDLERLDVLMPKALGITYGAALGSPNILMHQTCNYTRSSRLPPARIIETAACCNRWLRTHIWVLVCLGSKLRRRRGASS